MGQQEIIQALAAIRGFIVDNFGVNSQSGAIDLGTIVNLSRLEGDLLEELYFVEDD